MDGPVAAAIISSSIAVVVAVGTAVGTMRARRADRQHGEHRADLLAVQTTMVALRAALAAYGAAFEERAQQHPGGEPDNVNLEIPAQLEQARTTAQSEFEVAAARVSDVAVADSLAAWAQAARFGLLDVHEPTAASEQAAFDAVNRAIGEALRARN